MMLTPKEQEAMSSPRLLMARLNAEEDQLRAEIAATWPRWQRGLFWLLVRFFMPVHLWWERRRR